jgi:phage terminase small subunit
MATRGAKPKPAQLRLVDGTHNVTRHGSKADAEKVAASGQGFGKLKRPSYLKGQAKWAWERYIDPAGWLDATREAAAIAFCELWDEYRSMPRMFPAAKHGQMRAYMAELGLTDERNRGDFDPAENKDEFFGD